MDITFNPTLRQMEAIDVLMDSHTTEILFGGSAGGGKSFLGVAWIIMNALKYPGTRWLIARSRLGILKITTVKTFMDLIITWGLEDHVTYHLFNNNIQFKNGSEVLLMDLFTFPADPDFNKLGSLELTGALIDEASEISERAYSILTSRFRYKLNHYNLIPKLLIVSNPTRGWIYDNFYKADKDHSIKHYRKFIRSLPKDNPHLPDSYIQNLKRLPTLDRKRLYEGIWEFHKDEFDIFDIGQLYNSFETISSEREKKYITCDVAGSGGDRTVITYWEGLNCLDIQIFRVIDTNDIVSKIKEIQHKTNTPLKNIIVDSIGVGMGVADNLRCKKFVANAKPFDNEQFNHIKSQLFFKFAELVNSGSVGISYDKNKDDVIDELIAHKRYKGDQDGKYRVTPKDIVRRNINRSPDIADALVMRFYFEYKKEISFTFL